MLNFIYIFGSTEFFFLNVIEGMNKGGYFYSNSSYKVLLNLILIFSLMLKIGFAPLQLFKIEVYKSIPFLSIFFYTTFYFLVYFLYFGLLIIVYFSQIQIQIYNFLFIFILLGGLFVISLLFDINFIKAFFAYSSLINSILFLGLLVGSFNLT